MRWKRCIRRKQHFAMRDVGGEFQPMQSLGAWYKPLDPGYVVIISTFKTELDALEGLLLGKIVLGDLNVHNKRWLRQSSADSTEGAALTQACDDAWLNQKGAQPTRGEETPYCAAGERVLAPYHLQ